jgi:hypothetical protein
MSSYPSERAVTRIEEPRRVPLDPEVTRILRQMLCTLAHECDETAAREAAQVPYWKACPHSVIGTREAARALRRAAESLTL